MPTTLLTLAEELAPYVVAIISVLGVVFTAYHERASQLKAAYFQKMSDAYEQYFDALVRYVYNDPPTGALLWSLPPIPLRFMRPQKYHTTYSY